MALTLAFFCALFLAIGAVSLTGRGEASEFAFAALAFALAIGLGVVAWGMHRSVQIDQAELALDTAVQGTLARRGQVCDCGHDHEPNELHVTDAECAHDGAGIECAHNCELCLLGGRRKAEK